MMTEVRLTQVDTGNQGSQDRRPAPSNGGRAKRRRRALPRIPAHALLIAITVMLLYPLIWLVVSSLRPTNEIFQGTGLVFTDISLKNYIRGWNALASPFGLFVFN